MNDQRSDIIERQCHVLSITWLYIVGTTIDKGKGFGFSKFLQEGEVHIFS